jgi:hypothetical protein
LLVERHPPIALRAGYASVMRVLLSLLAVAQASVAISCARPIVYACGHHGSREATSRVDVRARVADRNYDLEIVHVDGPGRGGICSPPAYAIGEEATLIEMRGGDYTLLAKAEDTAIPYAFPLRGQVSVESGRCYVPTMTCHGGGRPDALTCRLVLKPTACASHWLPRRVVLGGMSYC